MITTKEVTNDSKNEGNDDTGGVRRRWLARFATPNQARQSEALGASKKPLFPPDNQASIASAICSHLVKISIK
jgi:hypothetical protein